MDVVRVAGHELADLTLKHLVHEPTLEAAGLAVAADEWLAGCLIAFRMVVALDIGTVEEERGYLRDVVVEVVAVSRIGAVGQAAQWKVCLGT